MRDCEELRKVLERLDELEIMLNSLLEEVRELRGAKSERARGEGRGFLEILRARKFVPLAEVRSQAALRRLMERGLVIVLRDEGANKDVVVLKESARDLLDRLPMDLKAASQLDERTYELLQLLNRLGYVLVKEGKYIKTELAEEFYA